MIQSMVGFRFSFNNKFFSIFIIITSKKIFDHILTKKFLRTIFKKIYVWFSNHHTFCINDNSVRLLYRCFFVCFVISKQPPIQNKMWMRAPKQIFPLFNRSYSTIRLPKSNGLVIFFKK